VKPYILRLTDEEHEALVALAEQQGVSMQRIAIALLRTGLMMEKKLCPTCGHQPKSKHS
jgi:hypothetical protein